MLPEFPGQTLVPLAHPSYRSQIFSLEPAGSILKYRTGGGEKEPGILRWLQTNQFPSPSLLDAGADWMLMGRMPGDLQDPDNQATYRSLGETLSKLNQLPPPFPELEEMTLEGCHNWAEYCLENTRFLGLHDPLRTALQPLWEAKTLDTASLIHNDPYWKNVLVGPDGQVTGLLDWESALLGPQGHQVGTALAYIAHPGQPVSQPEVRQRQRAFLEGYGAEPPLHKTFEILRLLDSLSKAYRDKPYLPEDHLSLQQPPETRPQYQRLSRLQAELELRSLLQVPGAQQP